MSAVQEFVWSVLIFWTLAAGCLFAALIASGRRSREWAIEREIRQALAVANDDRWTDVDELAVRRMLRAAKGGGQR